MASLTTRQRDLLQILLHKREPLGAAELAEQLQLTARQVTYGLEGVKRWLANHDVSLKVTPGVGVSLDCSPDQTAWLVKELASETRLQLVLTPQQRETLVGLILLDAREPVILKQLQRWLQVSRTTAIKDVDAVSGWLEGFRLRLARRPNYGLWVEGSERDRRHAMAAVLWGYTPFDSTLFTINHTDGLSFELVDDADLLPVLKRVAEIIRQWDIRRIFSRVAYAETQLSGRFTDDAVLHLALSFAIQAYRIQTGAHLEEDAGNLERLRRLMVWPVAVEIGRRLGWRSNAAWSEQEVAFLAMHLLAAPRNERWPGDLEFDHSLSRLVDELMARIGAAYEIPHLGKDMSLRDGVVNHIIPAILRGRFQLWMPPPPAVTTLSDKYSFEIELARELAGLIALESGVELPESEINDLAMLLRAAYIRERPHQLRRVYVVCPSGMATAQLLVARLKAHFPRIGELQVVSMRALAQKQTEDVELIITTVPLNSEIAKRFQVIQVHPLLLPEDVEQITEFLT